MKNKKGFTLIELLAVIVILAIIALIAVPIVLNMINQARRSAARSTALGYVDAIEYNNGFAQIGTEGYTAVTSGNVSDINVKSKGKKPTSGTVTVDSNGRVTGATLCINNYTVVYENKDVTSVTSGCSSIPVIYPVYSTPGELIYFDPVSSNTCDENTFNLANVNNGTSTCYKWRVLTTEDNNTKEKITLQLDHNLLERIAWVTKADYNDDTNWEKYGNNKGPRTLLTSLANATSTWTRVPLLNYTYNTKNKDYDNIESSYGVLTCTNGTCTSACASGDNICSGMPSISGLRARIATDEEISKVKTSVGWENCYFLFENTRDDEEYSTANVYGENSSGYWTLTPTNDVECDDETINKCPNNSGYSIEYSLGGTMPINVSYGIGARPVIEIPKSLLQ